MLLGCFFESCLLVSCLIEWFHYFADNAEPKVNSLMILAFNLSSIPCQAGNEMCFNRPLCKYHIHVIFPICQYSEITKYLLTKMIEINLETREWWILKIGHLWLLMPILINMHLPTEFLQIFPKPHGRNKIALYDIFATCDLYSKN